MKYIRLYLTYAKRSLMGKFAYKTNVIIGILAFLITQVTTLLSLFLLIRVVPSVDGYSIYDIGFLFGITNMAIGIDHLFSDKLWTVAYHEVKMGKLDHMFLRPLPVLFQVFAHEIQLEAFGEIITAFALIIYCGVRVGFEISSLNVVVIIVGIICASVIITSFKILIASLAFVFGKSGPLLQVIYNFSTYTRYPLNIFPKVIRLILTFIVPLGLCIFIPYDNMFTNSYNSIGLIFVMLISTLLFLCVSLIVWNYLCKRYESTGS